MTEQFNDPAFVDLASEEQRAIKGGTLQRDGAAFMTMSDDICGGFTNEDESDFLGSQRGLLSMEEGETNGV